MRVGNDGILKIYSLVSSSTETQYKLIWSSRSDFVSEDEPVVPDFNSENPGFDISADLAKTLTYAGSYVPPGANLDFIEREKDGAMHVNNDEFKIEIQGTVSLAYELLAPFEIKKTSEISFDVTLGDHTEILAICVDDGLTTKKVGDGRALSSCLILGGTAAEDYKQQPEEITRPDVLKHFKPERVRILDPTTNINIENSVTYPLRDLFPDVISSIRYIGFVQVNDAILSDSSESFIQNLKFEDKNPLRRLLVQTANDDCKKDEIMASLYPGLRSDQGEFCVPSEIMLQQIEKDEGDSCSNHHQCRSGVCETSCIFDFCGPALCISKVSEKHRLSKTNVHNFLIKSILLQDLILRTASGQQGGSMSEPVLFKMTWKRNYGTSFVKDGGSTVNDNGIISLYGNVSKLYKIEEPYAVTGNTYFYFDFELLSEAEEHVICVEEDEDPDIFAGFHKRCIGVGGTQFDKWSDHLIEKVKGPPFRVNVGLFFPDIEKQIKYIAFVQSNYAAPLKGISKFSNFWFQEEERVSFQKLLYPFAKSLQS